MSEEGEGRIEAIWIKRARGGPMAPVLRAELLAGRGIVGNANQGGRRQVTVLSSEAWAAAVADLGTDVDASARRANVLVSGVSLEEVRGGVLRLGACRIRLGGETRPCHQMDEACQGLRAALDPRWRGGAFGVVLDDGELAVGDPVTWAESAK